jgi:hypothetical protein
LVWRTLDPSLDKRVQAAARDTGLSRSRVPVNVRVTGEVGSFLAVQVTDASGRTATATGTVTLAAPTGSAAGGGGEGGAGGGEGGEGEGGSRSSREVLGQHVAKAVGALGDTPFSVGALQLELGVSAPALPYVRGADVKALRKAAVLQLLALRAADAVARTAAGLHRPGAAAAGPAGVEGAFAGPLAPVLRAEATAVAVARAAAVYARLQEQAPPAGQSPNARQSPAWGSLGVLCRNQAQVG